MTNEKYQEAQRAHEQAVCDSVKAEKRVCACCGAREGERHHDESYRHLITTLIRSRRRKRLECQPCRDGLRLLALERGMGLWSGR